jgi:hypothetical protein
VGDSYVYELAKEKEDRNGNGVQIHALHNGLHFGNLGCWAPLLKIQKKGLGQDWAEFFGNYIL